ncbi:hypothetical protein NQ318_020527 [Aromia moschata]|uniref:Uncharacterized protein n=1 Tax=Aromia moschata TaxID=1265417 RepID=A0AAV8Z054_9CUCU|nr:hypothetical protein NQ318_020527 [Aromia moschata]
MEFVGSRSEECHRDRQSNDGGLSIFGKALYGMFYFTYLSLKTQSLDVCRLNLFRFVGNLFTDFVKKKYRYCNITQIGTNYPYSSPWLGNHWGSVLTEIGRVQNRQQMRIAPAHNH